MLPERLQQIRASIEEKKRLTDTENEFLKILNHMDMMEETIVSTVALQATSDGLLEMIIRPAGKNCPTCGRTIEMK